MNSKHVHANSTLDTVWSLSGIPAGKRPYDSIATVGGQSPLWRHSDHGLPQKFSCPSTSATVKECHCEEHDHLAVASTV